MGAGTRVPPLTAPVVMLLLTLALAVAGTAAFARRDLATA
ncbi:hypothetical protein FB384_001422 [Prauserella sediminis]|uniref:Uncharacterized protein n=1 Tax=Prauserella sediminis TaxID=577680 RepID=A0A839XNU8_9PSEU|nr:hypothetical protein [Prauserella sediminis]